MWLLWLSFIAFILALLALDLGVIHRQSKIIGLREALIWSGGWVSVALMFNVAVYYLYSHHVFDIGLHSAKPVSGQTAALQFFTGYIIEKSLSIDNIFVIAMIFAYFRVPGELQHRVLFWGILGALVMRGIMIAAGAALIARFDWIIYVFGGLLLITAVKMLVTRHDNIEPDKNPFVKLARRLYPVSDRYHGQRFLVTVDGQRLITPLLLVLIVIESTDVLFAVDSIPAIFAVTHDPFLVFTSNVFAILGLRALYFALAGMMHKFRFLKTSLVFVLAYVGVKMCLSHVYPIPIPVSLAVIAGILTVGVLASIVGADRDTAPLSSPLSADNDPVAKEASN
jgi:tellurite resistance protein TerC